LTTGSAFDLIPVPNFQLTTLTETGSGSTVNTLCTNISVEEMNSFSVYPSPNPFSDELKITGTKINGEIFMFDITGSIIQQYQSEFEETKLNTSELSPGIYILNYINGNKIVNLKVVRH
jgi:hypothetical protein